MKKTYIRTCSHSVHDCITATYVACILWCNQVHVIIISWRPCHRSDSIRVHDCKRIRGFEIDPDCLIQCNFVEHPSPLSQFSRPLTWAVYGFCVRTPNNMYTVHVRTLYKSWPIVKKHAHVHIRHRYIRAYRHDIGFNGKANLGLKFAIINLDRPLPSGSTLRDCQTACKKHLDL